MTERIKRVLVQSATARWMVLFMVSFTMMCGYYLTDVMAPLERQLGTQMGWTGADYGVFNSAYGWLNFTLLMLIFAGMLLDKIGPRLTGLIAVGVMVTGISVKAYAIGFMEPGQMVEFWFFGPTQLSSQVLTASIGYAVFAMGYETLGITATKIIVRWFKPSGGVGFALGMNIAMARMGTMLAMSLTLPAVSLFGSLAAPIYIGLGLLGLGFITFIIFVFIDRKLDKEQAQEGLAEDEKFRFADILSIFRVKGFWLIALMCLLFYAAVFPFLKFATGFMVERFGVDEDFAGAIPALLPFGTMLLTPIFGRIYDKRGRGVTIMIIGSALLIFIYWVFSFDLVTSWVVAAGLVVLLGIAFSLVPSALWPSVARIIPQQRLGTAYALIFWLQNLGLAGVPLAMGMIRDAFCVVSPAEGGVMASYDYTLQMLIFMGLGVAAVVVGLMLKREDRIKGYGIEQSRGNG